MVKYANSETSNSKAVTRFSTIIGTALQMVLGDSLVESVPEDTAKYQKWLQSQRDFLTKWGSLLQEFLTIQPDDLRQLQSDRPHMPVFHAAFDKRLQGDAPPVVNTGLITCSSYGPTSLTSTEKSSLLITEPTSASITSPGTVNG